jgi:hypothetical protein
MLIKMQEHYFSNNQIVVDVPLDGRHDGECQTPSRNPRGIYCRLNDNVVGLFVFEKELYIFLNGIIDEVRGGGVAASFSSEGEDRQLRITIVQAVTTIFYKNSRLPVSTPFYSEDEEDCEFGLWLANILSSEERQEIAIQSWSAW